jgi:hypothetical protein
LTVVMGELKQTISGHVARVHENDRPGPWSVFEVTESQSHIAQSIPIEGYSI